MLPNGIGIVLLSIFIPKVCKHNTGSHLALDHRRSIGAGDCPRNLCGCFQIASAEIG